MDHFPERTISIGSLVADAFWLSCFWSVDRSGCDRFPPTHPLCHSISHLSVARIIRHPSPSLPSNQTSSLLLLRLVILSLVSSIFVYFHKKTRNVWSDLNSSGRTSFFESHSTFASACPVRLLHFLFFLLDLYRSFVRFGVIIKTVVIMYLQSACLLFCWPGRTIKLNVFTHWHVHFLAYSTKLIELFLSSCANLVWMHS